MEPKPHGGHLVDRWMPETERSRREAEMADLPQLVPFVDQIYDVEKIGIGAYSPLEGFMDSATLQSVLSTGRLPNGLPWTMPVLLPIPPTPTRRPTRGYSRERRSRCSMPTVGSSACSE